MFKKIARRKIIRRRRKGRIVHPAVRKNMSRHLKNLPVMKKITKKRRKKTIRKVIRKMVVKK